MSSKTLLLDAVNYIHTHVLYLNNSKFFAGVIMILLNVGSKFIPIQFSRSTEEYLKMSVTKQLLVFAMAWMGTRDIYASLVLTAVFTILSENLFNEESKYCIVPEKYRILSKLIDTNNNGTVSEVEINAAIAVLEKAKKEKLRKNQKESFALYHEYLTNHDKIV
uniref:EF-hand domain-containing protein n=1 Tax=viral metagenome TaxID=1070528 RepID=A0A6C0E3L8_9ZZZZ